MTTPRIFSEACRQQDLAVARGLLAEKPALAHAPRPLIEAAASGRADLVRLLLAAGADPAAPAPRATSNRPLFQCLAPKGDKGRGHRDVVRALVEAGADLGARGAYQSLTPLCLSAVSGDRQMVDLLIGLGAEVDLFAAAMIADVARLRGLLAQDPGLVRALDPRGRTALHALGMARLWRTGAEEEARALSTARLLLDAGADPGAPTVKPGSKGGFSPSPLWWAISSGRCEPLCLLLLERGAPTAACLSAAAYHVLPLVFGALVDAGADVDERSNKGCTPLHDVLFFDRPALVGGLLEHGADPNLRTPQGHTGLHLAAAMGHSPQIVRALIEAGADAEVRDDQGLTPLELAVKRGHAETAAALQSVQSMGA